MKARCALTAQQVVNVNDAPVVSMSDRAITVSRFADSSSAYVFSAADFAFTDEDGDDLASITIATLTAPAGATFTADGTAVVAGTSVDAADLGTLIFYPAAGADAADDYASFTFTVTDDGDAATGSTTSAAATITINLADIQVTATGAPTVAATTAGEMAFNEDVSLTATTDRHQ